MRPAANMRERSFQLIPNEPLIGNETLIPALPFLAKCKLELDAVKTILIEL